MSAIRYFIKSLPLSLLSLLLVLLGLGLSLNLLLDPGAAYAAPAITIKVNTLADNTTSDNFISLREAILLVNGGTGGDGSRTGLNRPLSVAEGNQILGGTIGATGVAANIVFTDLPGLSTIALTQGTGSPNESLPPVLTSGVVINGLNGAGGRMIIDGSGAGVPAVSNIFWFGWADGVGTTVQVSDITLRSLIVTGAKQYGIFLNPARASLVAQCDVQQSAGFALFIQSKFGNTDGNIIEDCTIGNNASLGIVVNRPGAFNNIIRNNRIGTNAAGTAAAPNTGAGVALFTGTHDNTITGNLISGNTVQGIYLDGTASVTLNDPSLRVTNTLIQGNRIGTKADGSTALPNVQGIVFNDGCRNNLIGGTGAGEGNIIAFNTESGIVVVGNNTRGNRFSRNSLFQNGLLGIDLLDDKLPTPGVSGGDIGPNQLALRPTLTKAQASGSFGVAAGTASPVSTIEIFVSDGSLSGYGSGKTYCATTTSDASGAFRYSGTMACTPGSASLTATSTLVDGSTSEFGNNLATTPAPRLSLPIIERN